MATQLHSSIFTNRDGNTLMREFEGVLEHNPTIKNLDAVVGFFRASGYFSLRPFLDSINKVRVLIGIDVDKYIVEANKRGQLFFGADKSISSILLSSFGAKTGAISSSSSKSGSALPAYLL